MYPANIRANGFIRRPIELASYIRFLESHYGSVFTGLNGFLLKNYLGNYINWWRRLEVHTEDTWKKALVNFIPPWPFPVAQI